MNSKELELRRDVETIGKANLKFDWDMDTVLTAFTEFEDPKNGLEKTLEYWEEFLKSEMYEEYWKGYRKNGKYHNWELHLADVMCMFKMYIREKTARLDAKS